MLLMAAVLALNGHFRGSDSCPACIRDDSWHDYELAYKVALQLSQHAGQFCTVNLYLEVWNIVAFKEVLREIVSLVNLLHCFLELKTHTQCFLTSGMYSDG
jgi:hypothetical protein